MKHIERALARVSAAINPSQNTENISIVLGEDSAPERILRKAQYESDYHAVLIKRFGAVSAADFIKYTRRFSSLCNQMYGYTTAELRIGDIVPVGPLENYLAGFHGFCPSKAGGIADLEIIDQSKLEQEVERLGTIVFRLHPTVARKHLHSSFAQVEWTKRLPKKIMFYAQQLREDGGQDKLPPLVDLLYKKMFYVRGSAPNLAFKVRLGIGAYLKEVNG